MSRFIQSTVLAISLVLLLPAFASAVLSVENFTFESFEAEYYLSADDEGRAQMRVTETLIANFPDYDQNKGIVREIPHSYQGKPVSFELISLERNGDKEPVYDKTRSGDFIELSTGTDEYIHGTQEYTITYELRDVIADFDAHQELFWDVNGTGWRQPFGAVSATVYLDDSIAENFTGNATCYQGRSGSQEPCDYEVHDDQAVFTATRSFAIGENLSLVMEFEPDTFTPYEEGIGGTFRWLLAALSVLLSVAGIISIIRLKLGARDHPGRGLVVRQYIPPKNTSVLLAGMVDRRPKIVKKAFTAQIMELAVNKKIKIIDTGNRTFPLFGKRVYELEIIDTNDISPEGKAVLRALFGSSYKVGRRHKVNDSSSKTALAIQNLQKSVKKKVITKGYRKKTTGKYTPALLAGAGVGSAIALLMWLDHAGIGVDFSGDLRTLALPIAAVSGLINMIILSRNLDPLTEKGRELYDYVRGMKEYISLAETERLQFAQSPDGAQRKPINTNDTEEVVKLYERLLPYAVLFSEEKDWFKELGKYYELQNEAPTWYAGYGAFNASSFSGAMSQVSSAATSTSSSGFSGGSGSGGGGGGGGGGGR